MTALKSEVNSTKIKPNDLFKDYFWFYSNIYEKVQSAVNEYFQKDIELRFMGVSIDENILAYGDEYFVNHIPVSKNSVVKIKISSDLVSSILDVTLGGSDRAFALKTMTDIEAMLMKSFTLFVYKNIEEPLIKAELNKKVLESAKEYSMTFYAKCSEKHAGKIILTIPDYMIPPIEIPEYEENYDISDFESAKIKVKLSAGSSKIKLNEIKTIEDGDVILLENSNINKMSILWDDNKVEFNIDPDPSLIISVDNNGGNEMEESSSVKSQNMWDSILVDIVAEFDNVKLTLGELKQISEGLVIDVGSVYENKIKLRVENQVVATGELVILNDRYGVRIDNIAKVKESEPKKEVTSVSAETKAENIEAVSTNEMQKNKETDKNFDYSDFEIEDESI